MDTSIIAAAMVLIAVLIRLPSGSATPGLLPGTSMRGALQPFSARRLAPASRERAIRVVIRPGGPGPVSPRLLARICQATEGGLGHGALEAPGERPPQPRQPGAGPRARVQQD